MKYLDIITFCLIVICALAIVWFFIFGMKLEGSKCLNDPLVYGVAKLQEKNQYPLMCTCNLISNGQAESLIFNSTGKSFIKLNNFQIEGQINQSDLNAKLKELLNSS